MNMSSVQHAMLCSEGWLNAITQPAVDHLLLVIAPHAAAPLIWELAARLAVNGAVHVLDGGNRFNVYPVVKALRRLTSDLEAALKRITLSRAFTCYQMLSLLQETPASDAPTLLLDLLATFFDENVTLPESQRLLATCLPHLKRLSARAPLIISVKPPAPIAVERQVLIDQLQQAVAQTWTLEPPIP
jgi:hypothetical protein